MNMFSPPLTEPERSSPSSRMIGGPEYGAWNALPSACTTPLSPLVSSHRQARSRSIPPDPPPPASRARKPFLAGAGAAPVLHCRLIRSCPPAPPRLVSETLGAALVRVTLDSDTPPAAGVRGGGAAFGRLV